ncbi:hypothetical protein OE88DRAFT_145360 [Heliocybe sulcata]|uniref:Uncharacterized protein n=1 Tax=Heliocybe sulcata TaxID=5364 RepID=A0A5C3NIH8_9AGAM|nr:hypothetical protein OE88DRAFT_145360 [Heliocybe sulcata]
MSPNSKQGPTAALRICRISSGSDPEDLGLLNSKSIACHTSGAAYCFDEQAVILSRFLAMTSLWSPAIMMLSEAPISLFSRSWIRRICSRIEAVVLADRLEKTRASMVAACPKSATFRYSCIARERQSTTGPSTSQQTGGWIGGRIPECCRYVARHNRQSRSPPRCRTASRVRILTAVLTTHLDAFALRRSPS